MDLEKNEFIDDKERSISTHHSNMIIEQSIG